MDFSYFYSFEFSVDSVGCCVRTGDCILISFWKVGPGVMFPEPTYFFIYFASEEKTDLDCFCDCFGIWEHGFAAGLSGADWADVCVGFCVFDAVHREAFAEKFFICVEVRVDFQPDFYHFLKK